MIRIGEHAILILLPESVRRKVIDLVSSDKYFTAHGFATESPSSPFYRDDGYWRGPIWAPSTMLMIDGLEKCGKAALAREAARRFVDMTAASGFAENFDALTGKGLRDLETGAEYTQRIALPLPSHMMDATTVIPEPAEYLFPVQVGAGSLKFLEMMK